MLSNVFFTVLFIVSRLLSQGQAKVFALLEGLDCLPEDAEVYIILEGSTLVHVTRAQSDVMLCFIVPGMCIPVCDVLTCSDCLNLELDTHTHSRMCSL